MSVTHHNRIICLLALLLLSLLLTGLVPTQAHAADRTELALPVRQGVSGPGAEQAVIQYRLRASRADSPLPAGSEKGVYAFSLTGSSLATLPPIRFDSAGEWNYTLSCVGPADPHTQLKETKGGYKLRITAAEEDDGLLITAVATDAKGRKCDLQFDHTIQPPEAASSPKTGDAAPLRLYAGLLRLSMTAAIASGILLRKKLRS